MKIVSIPSSFGDTGNIRRSNQAASISGLFGLTKSQAREAVCHVSGAGKLEEDMIGRLVTGSRRGASRLS